MVDSAKRVAVALGGNYEDIEFTSPVDALKASGADITIIGTETGEVKGKKGDVQTASTTFGDADPRDFDMLLIPGGGGPENLRINDAAVDFTAKFFASGKPVAAICHGPQLLISAKVLSGRTLTSVNKVRDDIVNAGGTWVDESVVEDGNLITSRTPNDLPDFNQAITRSLSR